jgi:N-methylhydantoinase B
METRFPIIVECLEFASEMAGAGRFRGGKGVRKQYRMLESDCYMALVTENTKDPTGKGLNGGHNAKTGYFVINPGQKNEQTYRRALSSIGPFAKGDTWCVVTGGGGGWGPPTTRDSERVLYDVRNGFIDATEARDVYGVEVAIHNGVWRIERLVRDSAA